MARKRAILYVTDTVDNSRNSLFPTLSAAGYEVVTAYSSHQAVVLSISPGIDAAIIHVAAPESAYSIAEKLKFVKPEMLVLLVNTSTQCSRALPPFIDAATYSDLPDEAVMAIRAFLH